MEKVIVTALSTHHGRYGLVLTGQEYETDKLHASELKRNGLVSYDGPAAAETPREKLNISDKPKEKVEKVITPEKVELKPGELPKDKKIK